jgi:hypothetical protein
VCCKRVVAAAGRPEAVEAAATSSGKENSVLARRVSGSA